MKSCGKSPRRVMVTRGECFWVACNRLIISFFVFMLFGRGKRWCQTGVVYAIGVSSFSYSWSAWTYGNSSLLNYYIGGVHLFTKLVVSI